MSERKYVLHSGYVTSRRDNDRHYIDAVRLAHLYHVPLNECLIAVEVYREDRPLGVDGLIHLYPDFTGRYVAGEIVAGLGEVEEVERD